MNIKKIIRVGLVGNPNCGKTTLFNSMTGSHQKVGNYAGVTVEKKEGRVIFNDVEFIIYDLPGIYSLTAYSLDEVVARDFIIEEKPDVIINVLDSTNIERNLYLCLQFQEMGIPVIGALNIIDQAESRGIFIDEKKLSTVLGIPMIKTVASKKQGVEELLSKVIEVHNGKKTQDRYVSYGSELENEIEVINNILKTDEAFLERYPFRWMAIKLIEKDENAGNALRNYKMYNDLMNQVSVSIKKIETHFAADSEMIVSQQRYAYVHGAVAETVKIVEKNTSKISEKIDKIFLNRILGLPLFLMIIWGIFQITFKLGEYPMGWLETFFGWLARVCSSMIPEGLFQSLVVDGIIKGVGGVFSFVPLIIILFLFISLLEDSGYMARAAFIMDKFLHIFGLHGQSFLPMVLGFGCSVPAVMASRSLKSQRDRIVTVLVTPFMSCGAKLPVYILLAGAFFPENAGNVVLVIYSIGVLFALLSALLLKKTILKGNETPFVMELPLYRMPTLRAIIWHVTEKTWMYFKKAGTVILAAAVLIWVITSFPKINFDEQEYGQIKANYITENLNKFDNTTCEENAENYILTVQSEKQLEQSFAGSIGHAIEPLVRPIGFDWKIGVSLITGFAAKEVIVSTMGILYRVGPEEGEDSQSLREALVNSGSITPLVAFALMLFTLIMAPCFAAVAVIASELGWKWALFEILYSTAFAWIICFIVYRFGILIGLGV